MRWINFLHIYQPPYQDRGIVSQVVDESYRYIIDILERHPKYKITLNISGCLTEQLITYGFQDVIERIKKLAARGQIELVGTAKYHAILPLLPAHEIERQIWLNDEIHKKVFGNLYNPSGFFFPEMAYGRKVAQILQKKKYKWIILDEIASKEYQGSLYRYKIRGMKLGVVLRQRNYSKTYVPVEIRKSLENNNKDELVITGTDGELYGHHHRDNDKVLESVLQDERLETFTISEYLADERISVKEISLHKCSWESSEEELREKNPYALWDDPSNKIQQRLWQMTNVAIRYVNSSEQDKGWPWARNHLDRGLASCTFWWSSARRSLVFRPDMFHWSPDEIEKGLDDLIRSIRSLETLSKEKKIAAEKIYIALKKLIWIQHWKKQN